MLAVIVAVMMAAFIAGRIVRSISASRLETMRSRFQHYFPATAQHPDTTIQVPFPPEAEAPMIQGHGGSSATLVEVWSRCAVPFAALPGSGEAPGILCAALINDPGIGRQATIARSDASGTRVLATCGIGNALGREDAWIDVLPTKFHEGYLILVCGYFDRAGYSHVLLRREGTGLREVWRGKVGEFNQTSGSSLWSLHASFSYAGLTDNSRNEVLELGIVNDKDEYWAVYRWSRWKKAFILSSGRRPSL